MAKPIMDMLVKDGKVSRGWLGVAMVDLNRELAAQRKISATRGVLVANVEKGSPADHAGLQPDDVIIAVDGAAVTDGGHFRNAIAMKGAKAQILLEVLRGKRSEKLSATLIEAPEPKVTTRRARH
jgi:serine protease Do